MLTRRLYLSLFFASFLMLWLLLACEKEKTATQIETKEIRQELTTTTSRRDHEIVLADSLYAQAQKFANSALFDSSNQYFARAAAIYLRKAAQNGDSVAWQKYVWSHNKLGFNYAVVAIFDSAKKYLDWALKIGLEKFGENHIVVAGSYNNLGVLHYFKGDFEPAIDYYKKSLQIRRGILGEEHPEVAHSYSNIGTIYYHGIGDYDLALEYFKRALALQEKLSKRVPAEEASLHNNLGIAYADKGEFKLALEHHQKALRLRQNEWPEENHPDVASSYTNLGIACKYAKDYERAIQNLQRGVGLFQKIYRGDHHYIVISLQNLGLVFYEKGEHGRAITHFQTCLAMAHRLFGKHNPEIGVNYSALGMVYAKQHRYDEALAQYEKAAAALALNSNPATPYTNPPMKDILSEIYLLNLLDARGEALLASAEKSKNADRKLELFQAALSSFEQGLALIDSMRISYKAEGSKFWVGEKHFSIYEKAVSTAFLLHESTKDSRWLRRAFTFSEMAKAGVLQRALQESRARRFAGIPDSLLARERELRIDLTRINTQLLQLSPAGADSLQRKELENDFFSRRREYDALLTFFDSKYPQYYALKYQIQPVMVEDLQNLLDDQTVAVEYFAGDSAIYLFAVAKDRFDAMQLHKDPNLKKHLTALLGAIKTSSYDDYATNAFYFYQMLVAPVAHTAKNKKLIVIPDGVLNYIPFEALLTNAKSANGDAMDYRTLPYLLREHAVSYVYSASLLRQAVAPKSGQTNSTLLALAPVFPNGIPNKSGAAQMWNATATSNTHNALKGYLPETREEVEGIAALFRRNRSFFERWFSLTGTKILMESAASERNLKSQNLGHFRFIHFATHGLINEEVPDLSGVLFLDDSLSGEDGVLHLSEIYNLALDAELVVVSACESGVGKLSRGEGLLGLSRGFLYAGAKNLLVSLWQVNDASTARLMHEFYAGILAGQSRAEALRQAKLHLIQSETSNSEFAMLYG